MTLPYADAKVKEKEIKTIAKKVPLLMRVYDTIPRESKFPATGETDRTGAGEQNLPAVLPPLSLQLPLNSSVPTRFD